MDKTIRRKLEEKRIDRKRQRLEVIMKVLDDIIKLIKERCRNGLFLDDVTEGYINN